MIFFCFTVSSEGTATESTARYVDYWYYVAVPAGVVLAILVTIVIIGCKVNYERKKRNVQFVRSEFGRKLIM